ncbi:protein of unknown function [Rhodovastum atsumiense]|nr:protein of unknown function [Rhodovastum atsumiense]
MAISIDHSFIAIVSFQYPSTEGCPSGNEHPWPDGSALPGVPGGCLHRAWPAEILGDKHGRTPLVIPLGQTDADLGEIGIQQVGPVRRRVHQILVQLADIGLIQHRRVGAGDIGDVLAIGGSVVSGRLDAVARRTAVGAGMREDVLRHHPVAVPARGAGQLGIRDQRADAGLGAGRIHEREEVIFQRGIAPLRRHRRRGARIARHGGRHRGCWIRGRRGGRCRGPSIARLRDRRPSGEPVGGNGDRGSGLMGWRGIRRRMGRDRPPAPRIARRGIRSLVLRRVIRAAPCTLTGWPVMLEPGETLARLYRGRTILDVGSIRKLREILTKFHRSHFVGHFLSLSSNQYSAIDNQNSVIAECALQHYGFMSQDIYRLLIEIIAAEYFCSISIFAPYSHIVTNIFSVY